MGARNRREVLRGGLAALGLAATGTGTSGFVRAFAAGEAERRPWVTIRGIYGGWPTAFTERGENPADYGVNACWVGSGSLNAERIEEAHGLGLKVFAEFNSMHAAEYLKDHPEAAPIGTDGKPCPAPDGWQGVSAFDEGYRRNRMEAFRAALRDFAIDGIWLDYHHAHASWEQAEPNLPDTDFSPTALRRFREETGIELPEETPAAAEALLTRHREAWTKFRCAVFTDWVREYRGILDATRPEALLGTFHCPWSPGDRDGALRHKLAIDLESQSKYLDVLSIMPYHARFGHSTDRAWISRQTADLGRRLGVRGEPGERLKIWPIVQLADWGERVEVAEVAEALDHGTRKPATGVMIFHWGGVSKEWDKVKAMGAFYRGIAGTA